VKLVERILQVIHADDVRMVEQI